MINIISYDKSKNHFLSRQNAVRHTLSLRKRFVRVPDPKRPYKSMWTISDDYQRNHLKDKQRHLKMKRRSENAQGSSQTMDLDEAASWKSQDDLAKWLRQQNYDLWSPIRANSIEKKNTKNPFNDEIIDLGSSVMKSESQICNIQRYLKIEKNIFIHQTNCLVKWKTTRKVTQTLSTRKGEKKKNKRKRKRIEANFFKMMTTWHSSLTKVGGLFSFWEARKKSTLGMAGDWEAAVRGAGWGQRYSGFNVTG